MGGWEGRRTPVSETYLHSAPRGNEGPGPISNQWHFSEREELMDRSSGVCFYELSAATP